MLTAEAALLREAVERGIPVLGVCLGAQLLAHALGGRVVRLPQRIIAGSRSTPLPAAAGDPVIGVLPDGAMALHWNEDGIEPPPGAVELLAAATAPSRRSATANCAWGVQFHPEVHAEGLDSWYEAGYGELDRGGRHRGAGARSRRPPPPRPARAVRRAVRRLRQRGGRPHRRRVSDYPHRLAIPTRWNDNDVYGHVNNVEYYAFFDTVINAYLIREGGLDIHGGEVIGLCAESHCEFSAPARLPRDRHGRPAGRPPRQLERALRDRPVRRGGQRGRHRLVRARLRGPRDAAAGGHPAAPAVAALRGAQRASSCSLSRSSARPFCLRR